MVDFSSLRCSLWASMRKVCSRECTLEIGLRKNQLRALVAELSLTKLNALICWATSMVIIVTTTMTPTTLFMTVNFMTLLHPMLQVSPEPP